MTKQAAEHLAQEYYTFGQELALDNFSKTAGLPKEVIKKMIQAPLAGWAGAAGGLSSLAALENSGLSALAATPLIFGIGGGSAMLGGHLAGKGVDLTERGLAKLLSKIKK